MSKEIYKKQLLSFKWSETRKRIIDRAFGHCEGCREETELFEVHHTEYHGDHPSDTPDEFLKALCSSCHDNLHWQKRLAEYSKRKSELFSIGAPQQEIDNLVMEFNV